MSPFYQLQSTIGPTHNMNLTDVLEMKKVLHQLGLYEIPTHGLTQYPDEAFIKAIREFQSGNDLQPDGVMKPDGPTVRTMEYRYDEDQATPETLLQIGPADDNAVRTLQDVKSNNKGSYIWRTRSDGKVRSSHADRDGKIFSWDRPPEGGHPGEAYNCRCWAEETVVDCDYWRRLIESTEINLQKALEDFNKADQIYNEAKAALKILEDKCHNALDATPGRIGGSIAEGVIIGGAIASWPGAVAGGAKGLGDGINEATKDITESCLLSIEDSQEQANYDKAKKERDSIEFWIDSYRKDIAAYREEYEQGGCEN
ncbi:phage minor head protein [Magnetovibrio sp. PR-2]|uniref:phage minor head protein n=1 Tax=Magnetovibrio sp. PR-2 TaxID=3120356 RepID=UPI002FCE4877